MYEALHGRIARLAGEGELLRAGLKGVEKESLRADPAGAIAATAHPPALGSALTHPWLTTDYSEALLEFVTPPFPDRAEVARNLRDSHRFVVRNIGDELLWAASMPCEIRGDEAIPIARYGSSNSGRLRHLYRVGLGHRYGRMMQVIAGVHFNYSLPSGFWPVLAESGAAHGDRRAWHGTGRALADSHYFGLIRNLFRHGWLLLYLFGASPALSRSFLPAGAPELEAMGEDTWYAPFGTSLRMSDIGYTNRIPGGIGIRYDDLYSYAASLHRAITTPHPPWEALGVRRGGEYRQLNANLLQIENEYYSLGAPQAADPPRGTADRGAPAAGGAVRRASVHRPRPCIPHRACRGPPRVPGGLHAVLPAPRPARPSGRRSAGESTRTRTGSRSGGVIRPSPSSATRTRLPLRSWADEILDELTAVAELVRSPGDDPAAVVAAARASVGRPEATPSACVLEDVKASGGSYFEYVLNASRRHAEILRRDPLPDDERFRFEEEAARSIARQASLEASDSVTFEEYLAGFFA